MIYLIGLLLFIAFLLRVDFIFYIAYVCIGVYAWSLWSTARHLTWLRIERNFMQHAFHGETITIQIRMTNVSRLPIPWVHVQESAALELRSDDSLNTAVSIGGKQTAVFTYHLRGRQRGLYRVGPLRLTSSDVFGLTPDKNGLFPADYITIYPSITPLNKLGITSRLPFGTIVGRQRLFADPARPMGVRNFRSGDSIRQINWKSSAHTQQLMVKTFQPAISLETAVLLDLHQPGYNRQLRISTVEWGIEVAASLAAHLVEKQQRVGLLTNGVDPLSLAQETDLDLFDPETGRLQKGNMEAYRETPGKLIPPAIPPGNGRPHLMKLLERLARIEAEETIPLPQWATTACMSLSWGTTILVITPKGDYATCQALHRLVRSGFNPVLIVIEPDGNFGQVVERGRRLGFQAFNIAWERHLDQWREAR